MTLPHKKKTYTPEYDHDTIYSQLLRFIVPTFSDFAPSAKSFEAILSLLRRTLISPH